MPFFLVPFVPLNHKFRSSEAAKNGEHLDTIFAISPYKFKKIKNLHKSYVYLLHLTERTENMKLVINDKEYAVCDSCGTFKSGERCYNCHPLKMGDLDVCDQLRQYYGIPAKQVKEKKQPIRKEPWTDTDPNKIVKHHLLQYYFTGKQLVEMGLYENAPDWQLLETTAYKHNRMINGLKLHLYKFNGTWERYKNMTEQQIRELINNIPKAVIETFKK